MLGLRDTDAVDGPRRRRCPGTAFGATSGPLAHIGRASAASPWTPDIRAPCSCCTWDLALSAGLHWCAAGRAVGWPGGVIRGRSAALPDVAPLRDAPFWITYH